MSVLVLLDVERVREIQVHQVKDRQSYEDPPHPLHNDKGGQTGDPEEQVSLVHARRHGERKEAHGRAGEEQSAHLVLSALQRAPEPHQDDDSSSRDHRQTGVERGETEDRDGVGPDVRLPEPPQRPQVESPDTRVRIGAGRALIETDQFDRAQPEGQAEEDEHPRAE